MIKTWIVGHFHRQRKANILTLSLIIKYNYSLTLKCLLFPVEAGLIGWTLVFKLNRLKLRINWIQLYILSIITLDYYNLISSCLSRGRSVPGWWGGEKGVCSEWHREDLLWHRETDRGPHMELWAGMDYQDKMGLEMTKCLWFGNDIIV